MNEIPDWICDNCRSFEACLDEAECANSYQPDWQPEPPSPATPEPSLT